MRCYIVLSLIAYLAMSARSQSVFDFDRGIPAPPATQPAATPAALAKTFRDSCVKGTKQKDTAIASLAGDYVKDLQAAFDAAMSATRLEEANALQAELNRVKGGQAVNASAGKNAAILAARRRYDTAVSKVQAQERRERAELSKSYDQAMEEWVSAALRSHRLEEANAIRNEKLAVLADPLAGAGTAAPPVPPPLTVRATELPATKPTMVAADVPAGPSTRPADLKPVVVDLLTLVDPDKDTAEGTWHLADGKLTCEPKARTRIEFPYVPPEEYDYVLTFTRTTAKALPAWIKNGQRYALVVSVRRGGVEARLDDKPVTSYQTDFKDLTPARGTKLKHPDTLGLEVWNSTAVIEVARVTEVKGTGKSLR